MTPAIRAERDGAAASGGEHAALLTVLCGEIGDRNLPEHFVEHRSDGLRPRPTDARSSRRWPMTDGAMAFTSSGATKSRPSSTALALAARCKESAALGDMPSTTAGCDRVALAICTM